MRLMEEQEALMGDEEDDDDDYADKDELSDEDWEASIRLANDLEGAPNMGGDVMDAINDELLQYEIDNLSPDEEDALGKAARDAVAKYEEEMRMQAASSAGGRGNPPLSEEEIEEEDKEEGEEEIAQLAADDVDYSKKTVTELKDLLRGKGLKVSGKKADLIDRLESS